MDKYKALSVSDYMDKLPAKEKQILTKIHNQIMSLVSEMEERLSRGVPFFYYKGKRAIGFRTSKSYLPFFIKEGNVLNSLRLELSAYDTSSTVVRFTLEKPLREDLIEKSFVSKNKK